ncbi:Putative signal transducing protein [Peptoniphilus asaccharolyticus DSM 20463]|uniref:Putative signal transducing protein n=1 Tax=Peptoniphilus asaccharolyticus DSM 20463 TaxID=573058 RepID=A0A1W1VAE2_PEPAS|nr:DUF2007 domain-containing protein [Peptoniphilus asaccharolyticus]MBL7575722.1 DUF2007 domain-containing protein [Peptoniphilus asaccharolyticus]SMB90322.1 Putative signal transducing protein [Peptoniphilus asaccharolyticus DSM 20463]
MLKFKNIDEHEPKFVELISVIDRLKLGGIIGILEDNNIPHFEESSQMNDSTAQVIYANVGVGIRVYVPDEDLDRAKELLMSIGELPIE